MIDLLTLKDAMMTQITYRYVTVIGFMTNVIMTRT